MNGRSSSGTGSRATTRGSRALPGRGVPGLSGRRHRQLLLLPPLPGVAGGRAEDSRRAAVSEADGPLRLPQPGLPVPRGPAHRRHGARRPRAASFTLRSTRRPSSAASHVRDAGPGPVPRPASARSVRVGRTRAQTGRTRTSRRVWGALCLCRVDALPFVALGLAALSVLPARTGRSSGDWSSPWPRPLSSPRAASAPAARRASGTSGRFPRAGFRRPVGAEPGREPWLAGVVAGPRRPRRAFLVRGPPRGGTRLRAAARGPGRPPPPRLSASSSSGWTGPRGAARSLDRDVHDARRPAGAVRGRRLRPPPPASADGPLEG